MIAVEDDRNLLVLICVRDGITNQTPLIEGERFKE